MGLRPVLGTCWGRDRSISCTPDSIYRSVLRRLDGGGTIRLHDTVDSGQAMLGALPALLITCRAHGLRVGPLREHGICERGVGERGIGERGIGRRRLDQVRVRS